MFIALNFRCEINFEKCENIEKKHVKGLIMNSEFDVKRNKTYRDLRT